MSEGQRRSAEQEIEETEITERGTEETSEQDAEVMQEEKPEEEKKTGFLSRETLYSRINISLKSMDRFIGILIILLIVLLFVMFGPGHTDKKQTSHKQYTPGTYTSTLTLNNTNLEVEVSVDSSRINSIRFANLDETVTTMFPLIQPAIEEIADQIYDTQSLDAVELSDDAPYTSQIILNAIRQAVEKAAVNKTAASCISLIVFYPSTIR